MIVLAGLLFAGCLFALPASAPATTLTVNTLADSTDGSCAGTCSLRDAITQANTDNDGDTIQFSVTGTIPLASALPAITANVIIEGTPGSQLTVSGSNAYTVFTVNPGATVTISGLTIANGNTPNWGGGIYNGGTLTVTGCTFSGNSATWSEFSIDNMVGGGAVDNEGTLTVIGSTFSGNFASNPSSIAAGGAVSNDGTMTVINSTFSGNSAAAGTGNSGGGAISNGGPLMLINSTLSGNWAAWGGGIYNEGPMTLANSVVAGNFEIGQFSFASDLADQGAYATGVGNNGGNIVGTDAAAPPPDLAPLGNYGGPTQTMIPLPGSPAICAGLTANIPNGVTTDQRGGAMSATCPSGRVDAGAVQSNYLTVTTLSDTTADSPDCTSGTGNTCSLRVALTLANSSGEANLGFALSLFLSGTPSVSRAGTISLASSLPPVTGKLYLLGPGANLLTVSGGNSPAVGSVFTIASGADATLYGLTISNGNSPSGGGIYSEGTLTVTGGTVSGNQATGSGGGGIANRGTLTVTGSTVSGNRATDANGVGGAIASTGAMTVMDSTFSGNQTNGAGGGIFSSRGALTVINSTFNANIAQLAGGGISSSGTLTVTNSTLAGNSAGTAGGGIEGQAILANSIVAGNTTGGVANSDDCDNCGTPAAPNLIGGVTDISQVLGLLAYSPATAGVQVMMPLPDPSGALGVVCQGSSALAVDTNGTTLPTDARGYPMDSQCIGGQSFIDLGAAQSAYSGISVQQYNSVVGQFIAPSPTVQVLENNYVTGAGDGVNGIPVTLALSPDNPSAPPSWLSGTLTQITAPTQTASGLVSEASFGDLAISTAGTYTFTVTSPQLDLVTQNPPVFTVDPAAVTQLGFSTPPASTIAAGAIETPVMVQEETVNGAWLTSGADSITLTVTGPNSYLQTYTALAANGAVAFIPATQTIAGQYSYTAWATTASGTVSTPSAVWQTVTGQATAVSLAVSGYPSPQYAGVPATATVTAFDQYQNVAAGYSGAVTVTTSDTAATLTSSPMMLTNGTGTVTVAFATPGTQQSITADAAGLAGGSQSNIVVQPDPLLVVTTAQDDAGTASNCTPQTAPGTGADVACSLRDALLEAASLATANITFDSTQFGTAQTIQLLTASGTLTIPQFTGITGPTTGSGSTLTNLVTVSGGGSSTTFPIFTVNSGATGAAIANLIIANGNGIYGGAIYNDGALTVSGSAFSSNSAVFGGAIYNDGTLTLTGSTVSGNTAPDGGGILNDGTLTVTNSVISGNSASVGGGINNYSSGAIDPNTGNFGSGTLTLIGSTVSGNFAQYSGGGAYSDGTLTVTGSTFFGNSGQNGGGIYSEGTLTVAGSTFSGNFGQNGGSGIFNANWNAGALRLANSIVDGNWLGTSTAVSGYDDLDDATGNTVFTRAVGNNNGNVVGEYNVFGIAPTAPPSPAIVLAPLGNYGGSMQTMIPLPGSAAICAGTVTPAGGLTLPSTDQRGKPYDPVCPSGTVDAGSVQTNYALVFTTGPAPISPATAILPNTAFNAAVTLDESGSPFAPTPSVTIAPVRLTLTGPGTLSGGSASPDTHGVATYSLSIDTSGADDTLTASLTLNGTLGSAPGLALKAPSSTFTVERLTPTVSAWPTANAITYGQTLASSTLSGGTASVNGGFAWTTPSTTPGAGTPSESVTFTPTDATDYNSVTGSVSVTINKATPSVSPWPTANAITYGQTLASSTLSGGTASVNGGFAWTTPSATPEAGTPSESVTFTPTDATDYNSVTGSVTLAVNNAVAVIGSISPAFTSAGGAAFSLSVSGQGFATTSTIYWGATALATQYVSATQLTAQIPAADIVAEGIASITVQTPAPGGGASNSIQFEVDSAVSGTTPPTFTTVTAIVAPGSTAAYSVTLPSSATSVSVACLNLPSEASCSYSSTTNTVTIATASTTPAGTYHITVVFTETLPEAATAFILLPILLLPLLLLRRRMAARGLWLTACIGLVLMTALAFNTGCGGGGGGATAPQQTHQVTSSGAVTLTVQ